MINSRLSENAKESHLKARIDALESRLRSVPSRWSRAELAPTYYLFCRQGNALTTVGATTYYGLKQPASAVLTVPTVTPSSTPGACPDGLTEATLISDTGTTSTVWAGVNLKPDANPAITDYLGILSYITPFISRRIVRMPLVSDASVLVPVYLPWRV